MACIRTLSVSVRTSAYARECLWLMPTGRARGLCLSPRDVSSRMFDVFRPRIIKTRTTGKAWNRGYSLAASRPDELLASLVPRPSPSSVRNARAQFNAGVEKRAWTNFTRDPRHRRHKCLTRNSVTYSVLAMRVYVQLETTSQRISSLSGRRERGESRAGNSTGYSAELRD